MAADATARRAVPELSDPTTTSLNMLINSSSLKRVNAQAALGNRGCPSGTLSTFRPIRPALGAGIPHLARCRDLSRRPGLTSAVLQRLRQPLGSRQPGGTVGAIGKDRVPRIAYPTEVLAGPVGSSCGGHHLISTSGDHGTRVVLQLGIDLGDRLGEPAFMPDQAN